MALFRRKRPKSFEGNAIASCRRLRPDIDWKHSRSDDLIAGGDFTINLANLRLIWEDREEAARPAWLEGHLSEVLYQVERESGAPNDADVRSMIRPRAMVEGSRLDALIKGRDPSSVPPFKPLSDDLVGLVGVDSPTTISLVTGPALNDWETTFDALWSKGVNSINQLTDLGGWTHVNDSVFVSGTQDDYTNSRLLSPGYLDQLKINGPTVVFLPHRNALLVAPLIDDEAVSMACDLALQELNKPSPICAKPFVLVDGEFHPFVVGPEHAAYAKVTMLRLIDDDINYKQIVPQLADLLSGELLIAGFYVDRERLSSSTNWGPMPALLPRTDEIVFINDDGNPTHGMVVPWEAAATAYGDRMTLTEYYPPRYRVEGLPDLEAVRSAGTVPNNLSPF